MPIYWIRCLMPNRPFWMAGTYFYTFYSSTSFRCQITSDRIMVSTNDLPDSIIELQNWYFTCYFTDAYKCKTRVTETAHYKFKFSNFVIAHRQYTVLYKIRISYVAVYHPADAYTVEYESERDSPINILKLEFCSSRDRIGTASTRVDVPTCVLQNSVARYNKTLGDGLASEAVCWRFW